MRPLLVRTLCIVLALWIPQAATASHYLLRDVTDVIEAKYHPSLEKQGIRDTLALYEAVVTKQGRRSLAKTTGIQARMLQQWATFLDVMQIDGIGPKMVRLLRATGVKSLAIFRKQQAAPLRDRMKTANRGARYSEILPSVDVLAGWITNARKVPLRLE